MSDGHAVARYTGAYTVEALKRQIRTELGEQWQLYQEDALSTLLHPIVRLGGGAAIMLWLLCRAATRSAATVGLEIERAAPVENALRAAQMQAAKAEAEQAREASDAALSSKHRAATLTRQRTDALDAAKAAEALARHSSKRQARLAQQAKLLQEDSEKKRRQDIDMRRRKLDAKKEQLRKIRGDQLGPLETYLTRVYAGGALADEGAEGGAGSPPAPKKGQ
eukprot:COSAG05_NODE_332_length_11268_cov_132.023726_11_plen_222_part_00